MQEKREAGKEPHGLAILFVRGALQTGPKYVSSQKTSFSPRNVKFCVQHSNKLIYTK